MTRAHRTIAVALHDIEPATFERCALIRDWLDDHGVNHVTLLVIPARDLHPLAERSPDMVSWLIEREHGGDAIAQHGFQHLRSRRTRLHYRALRGLDAYDEAEFLGLDEHETDRAVSAGRRVLKLAGIEPRGFVAPAYAYTPALRKTLGDHFHWWAALLGLHRSHPVHSSNPVYSSDPVRSSDNVRSSNHVYSSEPVHSSNRVRSSNSVYSSIPVGKALHSSIPAGKARDPRVQAAERGRHRDLLGPPLALMSSGRLRRALSPALLRAGALVSGSTLRLDLHPSDLDRPGHMLALEWVLKRSTPNRQAVTYEELAFAGKP